MSMRTTTFFLLCIPLVLSAEEKPAAGPPMQASAEKSVTRPKLSPQMHAALSKLALPGVKINVEQWCVDVQASVCLRQGMLELIACTKDTKEHESIFLVEAKPSHIHTALLLLNAKPGNPAMQRAIDAAGTRFMPVEPSGGRVDVFVVIKDDAGKETERPISDFIAAADPEDEVGGAAPADAEKPTKFPTHTFLFTGSVLLGEGKGPREYLCDQTGNVISIATFGDELLCLPGIHDPSDSLRTWQANSDTLPALDSKVILRLRPQLAPSGGPQPATNPPAQSEKDKNAAPGGK